MNHQVSLLPYPSDGIKLLSGSFVFSEILTLAFQDGCFAQSVSFFHEYLQNTLDREIHLIDNVTTPDLLVRQKADCPDEESYQLVVTREGCTLVSGSAKGIWFGLQTFIQLVRQAKQKLQCCSIIDAPALPWRGFMLDVARSFCPVEEILAVIDSMVLYKMNVLHLHISDDQGWRFPVEGYPELIDAERGYYSYEQLHEIVAYAEQRNVMVVPEVDMPGHMLAALSVYPGLSCNGGPFSVPIGEGIFRDILCVGKPEALDFARNVIDTLCMLFPSPFIHLGGDEIPLDRWQRCPDCQRQRQQLGLEDEKALLRWFCNALTTYARDKGKQVILWSDYVDDSYDSSILTQVWNPLLGKEKRANGGRQVIMSDYFHSYLDMSHDLVPLSRVYHYGKTVQRELVRNDRILGSELLLWTEYLDTREKRERHLYPRLLAGAEAFWTKRSSLHYGRFKQTLKHIIQHSPFLEKEVTDIRLWDPPLLKQRRERRKRKKRISANSKEAGITL